MTTEQKIQKVIVELDRAKLLLLEAYSEHLAQTGQERSELPWSVGPSYYDVTRGPLNEVR